MMGALLLADTTDSLLIDLATRSGPVAALLIIILYGGFKQNPWWVFGWVYRDLLRRYNRRGEQLDKWWDTAQKATATATTTAEFLKNLKPVPGDTDEGEK